MARKLLIFDFDGTAVDTITDVGLCFNAALKEYGFPQHPLEAFNGFVGGDLETVVARMLPPKERTEENIDRVKTVYRSIYLSSSKLNTKPYPGIPKLLEELKTAGYLLAVNSNKGQALLDDLTSKLFPQGCWDAVVGYLDTRPPKPDAYGVDLICATCGCEREQACYIGDGKSDIDTSANAKIPCFLVGWGQGTPQDWTDTRVAVRVETVEQLREAVLNQEALYAKF